MEKILPSHSTAAYIFFLTHSLARCWLLNASRDSAKMLVWQQQQTKEILILIRCPFRSAHKINACILSLNSTFLLLFSLVPSSFIFLICCCFLVTWWSCIRASKSNRENWASIKIDCVHQLLFGCCGKILNENFIHPPETRDPCLLAIIALWRLRIEKSM